MNTSPSSWIGYANGTFGPQSSLQVRTLDRGYLFGDGLYDVIGVFDHRPVGVSLHLSRLSAMLQALEYPEAFISGLPSRLLELCPKMIELNRAFFEGNFGLYIQVTRGAQNQRSYLWQDVGLESPSLVLLPQALPVYKKEGLKVISREDLRWGFGNYKTTSNLASVILKRAAEKENAEELLLFRNRYLTEGGSSNVFAVFGDEIATPSVRKGEIFSGITRHLLLEILKQHSAYRVCVRPISQDELEGADEIWFTGALKGVVPVAFWGDRRLPGGSGEVYQEASSLLQAHWHEDFKVHTYPLYEEGA